MGDFFHGYRRKMGCVTLVIACALMGAWTRSTFVGDEISIRHAPFLHYIYSISGLFQWDRYIDAPVNPSSPIGRIFNVPNQWISLPPDSWYCGGLWQNTAMDWQIEWCWLRLGVGRKLAGHDSKMNPIYQSVGSCVIPYGMLVVPLTLLSAYLLLCKPQANKPCRTPPPASA